MLNFHKIKSCTYFIRLSVLGESGKSFVKIMTLIITLWPFPAAIFCLINKDRLN